MDTLNLNKGETMNLTKTSTTPLVKIFAAAGWDMKKEGATMDLDLSAFLLNSEGKVTGKGRVVYYGHKTSECGAVASRGDNLTGAGDGDDETIDADLSKLAKDITKIVFVATIYEAKKKQQSLKDLDNAFIRIANAETQQELARYTITDTDNSHDSFTLGEVVRSGDEWTFTAIGEAETGELAHYATRYGIEANAA